MVTMIRLVLFSIVVMILMYQVYKLGVINAQLKVLDAVKVITDNMLNNPECFSDDYREAVVFYTRLIFRSLDIQSDTEVYKDEH